MNINWSAIKRMGRSQLLKSSYLWLFILPSIASVLSKAGEQIDIPLGADRHLQIPLSLPFSWTLFYFGAVAYSIGGIAYWIFCPTLIRDYDTFDGFDRTGRGFEFIPKIVYAEYGPNKGFSRCSWSKSKGSPGVSEKIEWVQKDFALLSHEYTRRFVESKFWPEPYKFSAWTEKGIIAKKIDIRKFEVLSEKQGEAFWFIRDRFEDHNYNMQKICLVCFLVAYGCYSWVAIQGLFYVCRILF